MEKAWFNFKCIFMISYMFNIYTAFMLYTYRDNVAAIFTSGEEKVEEIVVDVIPLLSLSLLGLIAPINGSIVALGLQKKAGLGAFIF